MSNPTEINARLSKAFEDLDDVQQFFVGNVKALVDKSDSVDKRLFEESKIKLRSALETISNHLVGAPYLDPWNTSQDLLQLPSIQTGPINAATAIALATFGHQLGVFNTMLHTRSSEATAELSDLVGEAREFRKCVNAEIYRGWKMQQESLQTRAKELKQQCTEEFRSAGLETSDELIEYFRLLDENFTNMDDLFSTLVEMSDRL